MTTHLPQLNNLFLRQSYLDAWEDYERSINKSNFYIWDYIILTASNEEQASTYREQIEYRLAHRQLPTRTNYAVLPDPDGKRVGSGGATFNVLKYIAEREETDKPFKGKRILVIHSGGDSKRVPQYSAVGKLFSPVPRELPDGRSSTLFDEFIIGMSGVPSRMQEGMLVLSGDVLLLFNPLQIDALSHGATAISIKEKVSVGKNHGVFLNDGNNFVAQFLHKQSEEHLREVGAVNNNDCVDIDTGAIIFDSDLIMSLYSLISTNGKIDNDKFNEFVNEKSRISFYGDFLYPLAKDSTLEQYYNEAAEGVINDELTACRTKIWDALHDYNLKLICLSPAKFIHFGTTKELLELVTDEVTEYKFLDWKKQVNSTGCFSSSFAAHNGYVGRNAVCNDNCYIENSYVLGNSYVGKNAIVSCAHIRNANVPENTVWHGLQLTNGKYVIRVYGVDDNPKARLSEGAKFLGTTVLDFMRNGGIAYSDLWDDKEDYIWFAKLYPICDSWEEAQKMALIISRIAVGQATKDDIALYKASKRISLYASFNKADTKAYSVFERGLESRILANKFIDKLSAGEYYKDALQVFGKNGITQEIFKVLLSDAETVDTPLKIRIYYAVSHAMKHNELTFDGMTYDVLESKCFGAIEKMVYDDAVKNLPDNNKIRIVKDEVTVKLPVRVNWGGGWTDTPPQCNEMGGVVLNTAIRLSSINPIQVTVRKLSEYKIEFESQDIGAKGDVYTADEIRDCHNPFDSFALHKAALIACGIVPLEGEETLEEILKHLGGGIYVSTQVIGIPKGSGLGTSSILSAACVKALYELMGLDADNDNVSDVVLCMEQIMSTGGGWQDQIGGLTNGIKLIRSKPGIHQKLSIEHLNISEETKKELQERFVIIYTGQRRLARNLLRDVVGNYIGARPESIEALKEMKQLALLMKYELEEGNIDAFADLLNKHWECSIKLDKGATNTCIDQIFNVCDDLICGRFICGAGGGGFLQAVLKKGITKQELHDRLYEVFQDGSVDVWDCEIAF